MKNQLKKINQILKSLGYNQSERLVLRVYLSVVFLNKSFDETANYFGLPYKIVRDAVTRLQVKFKNSAKFKEKMQLVVNAYKKENQLKLVA